MEGLLVCFLAGFVIGFIIMIVRRNSITSIIDSGDISLIPENLRKKYSGKGIPESDYMKQYEKEKMNWQMRHPFPFTLLAFIIGISCIALPLIVLGK